jgi:hypothetical protein
LEEVAPEAFKGMSEWADKSRKAAIKEIESLGFDYAAIKRSVSEKRSDGSELSAALAAAASDTSNDTPEQRTKKFVRKVRL